MRVGGGEDKRVAEEEEGEGEGEDDDMVVVAGGIIPTRDHNFLLGRGENDGDKESRYCDAIFGPATRITNAAVKVLRLIRKKRGGRR